MESQYLYMVQTKTLANFLQIYEILGNSPILQMNNLRLREVKSLDLGHIIHMNGRTRISIHVYMILKFTLEITML